MLPQNLCWLSGAQEDERRLRESLKQEQKAAKAREKVCRRRFTATYTSQGTWMCQRHLDHATAAVSPVFVTPQAADRHQTPCA